MGTRRKIIIIAAILVAIIVIVPLFYGGYLDPIIDKFTPISVKNGYKNVTYSDDFNDLCNSKDPFEFSVNPVVSTIVYNHQDSYINISITKGSVLYCGLYNTSFIRILFSVSGHFIDIHPYSMTLLFAAIGPNQYSVVLGPGGGLNKYQNVSNKYLCGFCIVSDGNAMPIAPLLNDGGALHYYNFSMDLWLHIRVKMDPGTSHTFEFGSQLNGMSKPVISKINMTFVED